MKTFKIVTTCTAISEYTLKAKDAEDAEAKFYDSEPYLTEKITDYQDEEITEVVEV